MSADLTNTTGNITTGTNYYIGDVPNYGSGFSYPVSWWWTYPVAPVHEHDFEQAREPYSQTLFCRKCGETRKLRLPK